jgi:hypothetical protein
MTNLEIKPYGKVYHDHEKKQAVFTDGAFMIISKELYDPSKTVEYIKKTKSKFDFSQFNYMRVIYSKENLREANIDLFKSEIYLAEENLFDEDIPYDDALHNVCFFKDYGISLTAPIIHNVNEFIKDNKNRSMKLFFNKDDVSSSILIEVYDDDFLNEGELLNLICFMPVRSNTTYQVMIENNILKNESGVYVKDVETLYSWSDVANALTDKGIPHTVVATLADTESALIYNRPIMNIFKFDDWLHDKYGDYESEGKSTSDMFKQLFGDDADKIAWYFGVGDNNAKNKFYDNANKVGE